MSGIFLLRDLAFAFTSIGADIPSDISIFLQMFTEVSVWSFLAMLFKITIILFLSLQPSPCSPTHLPTDTSAMPHTHTHTLTNSHYISFFEVFPWALFSIWTALTVFFLHLQEGRKEGKKEGRRCKINLFQFYNSNFLIIFIQKIIAFVHLNLQLILWVRFCPFMIKWTVTSSVSFCIALNLNFLRF